MRRSLLATVAVAVVVGLGGIAAAQSQMGGEGNKSSSGAAQEQKGGGMSGTQSGGKTLSPSAQGQGMEKGKQNERLGQGANQEQKGMTRGAQEQRGMQQKGAQEQQRGTTTKGAQEQRGPSITQQGAQQQRGTSTGANVGTSGARGTSVQLSADQRSQIKTIIGRERGPRLSGNVKFDVTVGTRIPRSVHIVVLPEEIVRIIPAYRGYEYFLVDDEIVIVDPRTLEIVAIIPA
jgi:hypothetical protein